MENKASLYNLAQEYLELEAELFAFADEETGELSVDIAKAVEKIQGDFNQKAISVATVWRDFGNYIAQIKAEKERLTALEKRVETQQKRIEDYLTQACEMTGTVEIRGVYANITFRNNPPKVVFDDESLIPEEYITETVKIEKSISKTKIKEAIQSGIEVAGAHLEQERKICIK